MPKFPFPSEELEDRIKASLNRIKDRICQLCWMGILYYYRGSNGKTYGKCVICGWTKEKD
jgi:hypothetical protein